ncbi:MAG: hypothetical protein JWP38_3739 [Herbaspirillum sp.]|nr:hypothetical protein [Herbaspirillum sp.]
MSVRSLSGGDKLKTALAELSKKINKAAAVKVGFLEGARYPDGTPVAMVAAIQNFGAPGVGIPPRPFFSDMIKEKNPEWAPSIGKLLVANDYDAAKALDLMGERIGEDLQQAIIDTDAPALSKTTLMLRKMRSQDQSLVVSGATVGEAAARVAAGESVGGVSTKVLDDSGHMLNSVGHEVTET